jgi:hypothetical protein
MPKIHLKATWFLSSKGNYMVVSYWDQTDGLDLVRQIIKRLQFSGMINYNYVPNETEGD